MSRVGAGVLWLAVACAAPSPRDARPDLLLITLDTTRADALGAYGGRAPTPNLDRLAERGLRFDDAMAVAPLTLPSHASMMTGLYPDRHGIRDNGRVLPDGLVTVAERLHEAGYATTAQVGAVILDRTTGIDQGFERFGPDFDLTGMDGLHDARATRRAEQVVQASLQDAGLHADDRPTFTWVHLYDAHQPYRPERDRLEATGDPYLAELAYLDHQLLALIRAHTEGTGRPFAVLVVGDHGEGRGDHGEATHGTFVYRSTLRVPMMLEGSGVPAGVRSGPVSGVDVAPTLLDLAGVPYEGLDGVSLVDAGQDPGRVVYGESYHQRYSLGLAELRVWQDGRRRYILAPDDELYDMQWDPTEQHDLADDQRSVADAWRERGLAWLAGRSIEVEGPADSLDPATRAALTELGYLGGAVDDAVPWSDLPDPKTRLGLQERVEAVMVLARTSPPAEAVPLLRDFCAANPRVRVARGLLVRALELSGDRVAALALARDLHTEDPEGLEAGLRVAELLLAMDQVEDARTALLALRARHLRDPLVATLLAETHRRTGACEQAVALLDAVLADRPETGVALQVRGACRMELGQVAGAVEDLERVVALDPAVADAHYLLGTSLLALGKPAEAVLALQEAATRTPGRAEVDGALGVALLASGRPDDAAAPLRAALAAGSAEPQVAVALADALLRTSGDRAEADRWLIHAETLAPDLAKVHEVRAAWLVAEGRSREAVDAMVRARSLRTPGPARP